MKPDTTQPVPPATGPAVNAPSRVQAEETMNPPIPEEILDSLRWIYLEAEPGSFEQYAGKHIAVFDRKVWGCSYDPDLLREYVALKYQLDPDRLVITYID
ncbi:MAG TPA: hypothetical protein VE999_23150 [Gemmataceae bacterium]|nr:hypothetical protein [Gemmataceae bacterium]